MIKSKIFISGKLTISRGDCIDINIELKTLYGGKSGVYEILNKENGKRYIGKARDLKVRKQHHESDIYNYKHKSEIMQMDFSASDCFNFDELFEFNIILYCRPSELTFYENILINSLKPEYNKKKVK